MAVYPAMDWLELDNGNVRLACGDCLEVMDDVDRSDMILADLPYGTTACQWDTIIPFELLWLHYKRIIKKNGAIVLTASQPFTTALIASNIKEFRYCWVWDKAIGRGHLVVKVRPMAQHEDVCVFYRSMPTYHPQMTRRAKPQAGRQFASSPTEIIKQRRVDGGARVLREFAYPKTILTFPPEKSVGHPTQKPVALMEYLIRTYTNEGETVLDNTMGSGTTGVACIKTGRKFIGIELDKGYFDIAVNRIKAAIRERDEMLIRRCAQEASPAAV